MVPAAPVVPVCTAEGQWTGTMAGRTFNGAVLDDRTYWFLCSEVSNADLAGTLQGECSTSNGAFTSSDGLDFNNDPFQEKLKVTVTGTVMPLNVPPTLDGTVTYSNGQLAFTSTFNSENSVPPVIANVEGTYSGSVFGSQHNITGFQHTITVHPDGTIDVTTPPNTGYTTGLGPNVSGIELGCDFTGTLTPRSQGGNMYNIVMNPSANVVWCPSGSLGKFTGVAFLMPTTARRSTFWR